MPFIIIIPSHHYKAPRKNYCQALQLSSGSAISKKGYFPCADCNGFRRFVQFEVIFYPIATTFLSIFRYLAGWKLTFLDNCLAISLFFLSLSYHFNSPTLFRLHEEFLFEQSPCHLIIVVNYSNFSNELKTIYFYITANEIFSMYEETVKRSLICSYCWTLILDHSFLVYIGHLCTCSMFVIVYL